MNVSLKELIETGRLGSIALGMTRSQVEDILGVPDDVGATSRKHPKPSIWKYGNLELHFVPGGDSLFLIHLDNFDVPFGGQSLILDPWFIHKNLTLSETEEQLARSGIRYASEHYELEDGAKCITVGVGVKFIFSGGNLTLRIVSYGIAATETNSPI